MAPRLLRDVGKMHEPGDDLESFFHVLGWTTLRYLPAVDSYGASCRGEDMKMFDEHRRSAGGHDIGGRLKASILRGGGYPSEDFQPGQPTPLSGLLRALSLPFQSVYSLDPPDAALRARYEELKRQCPDDEWVYEAHPVPIYDRGVGRLKSSLWFITTIGDALANETWPPDDKAVPDLAIGAPLDEW